MTDPNMKKVAFQTQDVVQGDDGELYHLPTLRALYRSGRLPFDSPAYCLVAGMEPQQRRLTA